MSHSRRHFAHGYKGLILHDLLLLSGENPRCVPHDAIQGEVDQGTTN